MKNRLTVWGLLWGALAVLGTLSSAQASLELDRKYLLENVGALRSWDNLDGLFGDYIQTAYRDYFKTQSRFKLQDLSRADPILSKSKIPYHQLIDDPAILTQLARSSRSDTLLRTKVYKEGPRYRFVIDWLLAPQMELIGTETFVFEDSTGASKFDLSRMQTELNPVLDKLLGKLPYFGHVTGRDGSSVVVNIGYYAKLKKGDVLQLATLDEVRKHPLLKTIVDWKLSSVGKVVVEQVDERLAFCRIVEEDQGREISKLHKVAAILAPIADPIEAAKSGDSVGSTPADGTTIYEEKGGRARLGWLQGVAWIGSLNRVFEKAETTTDLAVSKTGGGLLIGGKLEGQLWLNQSWFVEAATAYGTAGSYTQADTAADGANPTIGVATSVFFWRGYAGHLFLSGDSFAGPKGWLKVGYQSFSYSFPLSLTEFTTSSSISGPMIGIGGDLPIRDRYGLLLSIDFGLLQGFSETTPVVTGDVTGAQSLSLYIGGYGWLAPKMTLRVGIDLASHTGEFGGAASVNQKMWALGPSLLFYF